MLLSLSFFKDVIAQSEVIDINAIVAGCGDLVVSVGEECDTSNLDGESCATRGFTSGSLSCTASCSFNTSACVLTTPSGGGGGGSSSQKKTAQVVLSGKAYPKSTVTILKDAQIIATTVAGLDARFQVNIQTLSSGNYIFSVYSEDRKGVRSSLLTFPVSVTKNILTKIENIFIAPTIATDKSKVKKGDPIIIFGQSTPASEITLEVNSENQIFVKTLSDTVGTYLHNFDTSVLEMGDHYARSRATHNALISPQSASVQFAVGTQNLYTEQKTSCPAKADFNNDCRVNLVDFSIAAFWFNKTLTPSFTLREAEKLNSDGKINLVDFSIMAFYWTG